jgi:porin
VVQNTGDFLNSSMGYSPTIVTFPTYPEPKPGVSAFVHAKGGYGLGLGIFRTVGANTLSIVEPGRSWNVGKLEHPGRVTFGYWRLDGSIARFDNDDTSSAQGFYSVVEQVALRKPFAQDQGERRLSTFLQLGWAEGRVSGFTHHVGGGTILQAPFQRRSLDSIGLAATWVRFSSEPNAEFDLPSELVLESYYKITFNKHISLVQDFQFLHHPGGLRANRDCPVITPRLVISF